MAAMLIPSISSSLEREGGTTLVNKLMNLEKYQLGCLAMSSQPRVRLLATKLTDLL